MARTAMDPTIRFGDVIGLLEKADNDGDLRFQATDEREAIHMCHRLNRCRVAIREVYPDMAARFDRFVIRVMGDQVVIAPRPVYDLSRATRADGSPLSRDIPEYIKEYMRKQALRDVQAGRPYDPDKKFDIDELMGMDPSSLLDGSDE